MLMLLSNRRNGTRRETERGPCPFPVVLYVGTFWIASEDVAHNHEPSESSCRAGVAPSPLSSLSFLLPAEERSVQLCTSAAVRATNRGKYPGTAEAQLLEIM